MPASSRRAMLARKGCGRTRPGSGYHDPEREIAARGREAASPETSPIFVARARRCRCDKAHGPKERMRAAEGVADPTSKRLEGVRLVTASRSAAASQEIGDVSGLASGREVGMLEACRGEEMSSQNDSTLVWDERPPRAFEIAVEDKVLDDLHRRLRATRWPDRAPGDPWQLGTDVGSLR